MDGGFEAAGREAAHHAVQELRHGRKGDRWIRQIRQRQRGVHVTQNTRRGEKESLQITLNIGLMLGHRHGRWPSIKPMLGVRLLFAEYLYLC